MLSLVTAVPFGLPGTMPAAGNAAAAAAMAGLRLAAQQQIGTVLLVSNLNEEVSGGLKETWQTLQVE